jgi:CheY-like chemotaxis protein
MLLMILVKHLTQLGNEFQLQVDQCTSGLSALSVIETAFASKQPYHLILADILMDGGVDGYELGCLIRMKEEQNHACPCRVVGISVMTDENTKQRGKKFGFDALLKKPVSLDLLRAELCTIKGSN